MYEPSTPKRARTLALQCCGRGQRRVLGWAIGLVASVGAAGCAAEAPPTPVPAPAQPAAADPPAIPEAPQVAGDTLQASYACGGQRVDLVNNAAVARIAMSDGRLARLGAIAHSAPPTWRDVGLAFTLYPNGAVLEQEGGPALECTLLESASPRPVDSLAG